MEFPLALGVADLPHAYRRPISAASHVGHARYAAIDVEGTLQE